MVIYKNSMSIAGIAIAFSAFWSLWSNLEDIIELIIAFPKHGMYIERVRTFLDYVPKIKYGKYKASRFKTLTMKDVTFGYKEHEPVLKNINFEIKRGEKIAIVGYNGAGKSTFIKLILHLYEPEHGKILYNNQNVSEYTKESYRSHIGVVLQDFKIFAATIAENVLCDKYTKDQSSNILQVLKKATFKSKLEKLDKGIQSELTREFSDEGVLLSGGESQKLAISRVFARDYDLLILDEPSSALDPMAESELNHSILEASEDKTIIFISHRLSTTRRADRIYMFENGEIIEIGTHEELMNVNGKYAEMFNVQAEKYLINS